MQSEEFNPVFREYQIAFGKSPDQERTDVYFSSIQYYDARDVVEVLQQSKDDDEYFPTVSQLVTRLRTHRKPKTIICEYCSGSGFEVVYAPFAIIRITHKCGSPVTREDYQSDPISFRMFAKICRCRSGA